ncbi:hypothetical protein DICVIV_00446 [Dictyocaulus viviparus]|uniref:Uncharacterized protein n=1 Tax=Dictyocaulus viviparus TaxID=29172 RepID=A0A0D8Y911_DICVI|nr:hypothetical protein DICVIV_00446 [Dictyocaulus viviparus]
MNVAYKSIQRHYFVNSTNVGEQFFMFTSLAAWLIRMAGEENYEMPQESHDPNATIAKIMGHLRANHQYDVVVLVVLSDLLCPICCDL